MSSRGRLRRLSIGLVCVLAALQSEAVARAQAAFEWNHAVHNGLTNERIVGLIEVAQLAGSECDSKEPVTIKLYDTPSTAKPSSGQIEFGVTSYPAPGSACEVTYVALRRAGARSAVSMPTEESGYEVPALIAYERAGRWFRIALPRGSAWMMNTAPRSFQPYPEILREGLAFMTSGWDGRLWSTPDAPAARAVSPKVTHIIEQTKDGQRNVDVDVLAVRHAGGETWIQVRVTDGHCGDSDPVTLDTGWVPAHRPTRKPSVWFYSRGC